MYNIYIYTYITLHCIAMHCIALHYITLHTYIHYNYNMNQTSGTLLQLKMAGIQGLLSHLDS